MSVIITKPVAPNVSSGGGGTPDAHETTHRNGGSDALNHDNLAGMSGAEHVNHLNVEIATGSGLTGGGDTTATRTLSVDIPSLGALGSTAAGADYLMVSDTDDSGNLKKVLVSNLPTAGGGEANTASNTGTGDGLYAAKAGIDLQFKSITTASNKLSVIATTSELELDVDESEINHDALSGFETDEHVAHSGITISAGTALSGGGTIDGNITLDVDISSETEKGTPNTSDQFLIEQADGTFRRLLHGSIRHDRISNIGTNTHGEIDTHVSSGDIHFTEASIDHTNITNIGTNTHGEIDTHIADDTKHRLINDASVLTTNLWSGNKINAVTSALINDVVDDTSPELGGNLNAGGYVATNFDAVAFSTEFDKGDSGAIATISWDDYQKQRLELTANCTVDFEAPTGVGNYLLKVVQDTGGTNTVSWDDNVYWPGGTEPDVTSAGDSIDIFTFYYDGTTYFGMAGQDFGPPA